MQAWRACVHATGSAGPRRQRNGAVRRWLHCLQACVACTRMPHMHPYAPVPCSDGHGGLGGALGDRGWGGARRGLGLHDVAGAQEAAHPQRVESALRCPPAAAAVLSSSVAKRLGQRASEAAARSKGARLPLRRLLPRSCGQTGWERCHSRTCPLHTWREAAKLTQHARSHQCTHETVPCSYTGACGCRSLPAPCVKPAPFRRRCHWHPADSHCQVGWTKVNPSQLNSQREAAREEVHTCSQ